MVVTLSADTIINVSWRSSKERTCGLPHLLGGWSPVCGPYVRRLGRIALRVSLARVTERVRHDLHPGRAASAPRGAQERQPEARRYLSLIHDVGALSYPRDPDEATWERWIALQEDALRRKFTATLPPDDRYQRTETLVAGVPVHVLIPSSVADDDTSPLFLQFHGGALIMARGDLGLSGEDQT